MDTRSKGISGLPRFPAAQFREVKQPPRKGTAVRTVGSLSLTFMNGYLIGVVNSKGRLPAVGIVETAHPGYTVRLDNAPYTMLGYGYRKASKLAIRLGLRGHKRVVVYG